MGFINKLKGMVTTTTEDNDDFYPEVENEEDDELPPARTVSQPAPVQNEMTYTPAEPEVVPMEVRVERPESYASVTDIADHLLNQRTVVLDLEATNREVAKRLIDFLAGVAYSIDGQLKKISNNTYIITPCNVDVSESKIKSADFSRQVATQDAPTVSFTPTSDTFI